MKESTIALKTEACDILFQLIDISEGHWYKFNLICNMNMDFGVVLRKNNDCYMQYKDLEKLLEHFEHHHEYLRLSNNESVQPKYPELYESPWFFSPEIDFQLRSSDGEYESEDDGYYAIQIMFNYGKATGKNQDMFGFESTIYLDDHLDFCQSLRTFINNTPAI